NVSESGEVTDIALAVVAAKLLKSCNSAAQSNELPEADARRFLGLLLHLLVAVVQRRPAHHYALTPLAGLIAAAAAKGQGDELAVAFQAVCEVTLQRLSAAGGVASCSPQDLTPLFELLLAAATDLEEALYGSSVFGQLEQLAIAALGCTDRDLNRSLLQFLVKFALSSDTRVQQLFSRATPQLVAALMQNFHQWPAATRQHSSKLFTVLLERHSREFHTALLQTWQQPGTLDHIGEVSALALASIRPKDFSTGTWSAEQRETCVQLFNQLRGQRLKAEENLLLALCITPFWRQAFLGDLAAVANGAQTVDVLLAYQMNHAFERMRPTAI
ncbi:unnamed protein product, partial [Polarella glacialis]